MRLSLTAKHIATLRAHASTDDGGAAKKLIPDHAEFRRLCAELEEHELLAWIRTYEGEARQKNYGSTSRVLIETLLITALGNRFLLEAEQQAAEGA